MALFHLVFTQCIKIIFLGFQETQRDPAEGGKHDDEVMKVLSSNYGRGHPDRFEDVAIVDKSEADEEDGC